MRWCPWCPAVSSARRPASDGKLALNRRFSGVNNHCPVQPAPTLCLASIEPLSQQRRPHQRQARQAGKQGRVVLSARLLLRGGNAHLATYLMQSMHGVSVASLAESPAAPAVPPQQSPRPGAVQAVVVSRRDEGAVWPPRRLPRVQLSHTQHGAAATTAETACSGERGGRRPWQTQTCPSGRRRHAT